MFGPGSMMKPYTSYFTFENMEVDLYAKSCQLKTEKNT